MKIAAVTKFKHGELFKLLNRLGWSNIELARRSGVHQSLIGNVLNLKHRPSEKTINAIQKAFADVGEFVDVLSMFPDYYIGFGNKAPTVVQFKDMDKFQLEDFQRHQKYLLEDAQPPVPIEYLQREEALEAFDAVLKERERNMLKLRFMDGLTFTEIAEKYGIGIERVRQITNSALRKIRHELERQNLPKVNLPHAS